MTNADGSKADFTKQTYQHWNSSRKRLKVCANKKPRNDGYVGKWVDEYMKNSERDK